MKRTLIIAATFGLSTFAYSQASKTAPAKGTSSATSTSGAVVNPSKVNAAGNMSIQATRGTMLKGEGVNTKALPSHGLNSFIKKGASKADALNYYKQSLGNSNISVDGNIVSSDIVDGLLTSLDEAGFTFSSSDVDSDFVEAVRTEVSKEEWADPASLAATAQFAALFNQAYTKATSTANSEAISEGTSVLKPSYFENANQTGYSAQAEQCFL